MFGNQNGQQQNDNQIPDQAIDNVMNDQAAAQPQAAPQTVSPSGQQWQHPAMSQSVATPQYPGASAVPAVMPPSPPAGMPGAPAQDLDENRGETGELFDIKQQALNQLSPLIGHLEQTPEEKFRTTMMMIQASDDQTLIKSAYEAAQKITDEKVRAQALLDIINEINYFTQHHPDQPELQV